MFLTTTLFSINRTGFLRRIIRLLFIICLLGVFFPAKTATFTVSNLLDSGPGSLREAISQANVAAGLDNIVFSVSGTISPTSALPGISSPVLIDGTSAPGYVACGMPMIVVNGAAAAGNGLQLLSGASGSTIQALNVISFPANGIQMINSDNNVIRACYIGTTQNGLAAAGNNQNGLQVELGSDFNTIGGPNACDGNVISGNNGSGISLNSSNSNTISGNIVGLNFSGTAGVANRAPGILLVNGCSNNIIGGSTASDRNIVSGNGTGLTGNGVNIDGGSANSILGNYIGLNAAGTAGLGNAENGISINASPNTIIGGVGAFEGNVIADHNFHGIVLNGGSNSTNIFGNRIGTNAAGTAAFGNDDSGVIVINSNNVNIGGTAAGQGNILSGSLSEYGVFVIASLTTTVQGNIIGADITGNAPLPNFDGGVRIDFNSNQNIVGGTAAGAPNVIAFNTGYGVGVLSSNCTQNLISMNSIFCNTAKGIELNGLGNNNHPAPVITNFTAGGATGTATAGDVVELFYDSLCAGNCQGKNFIASVTANAVGAWSYIGPLIPSATLVAIGIRTALPATLVGNTSEAICFVNLPVEWTSFEASKSSGMTADLHWETASEINARHFAVERSQDGLNFEQIGRVAAQNRSEGAAYSFTDPAAEMGSNSYRLRQVDLNGDFNYSETRELVFGGSGISLQMGANPADDQISFELSGSELSKFSYSLYSQSGREIVANVPLPDQSNYSANIASTDLPAGIYYLRIVGQQYQTARKVMVLH